MKESLSQTAIIDDFGGGDLHLIFVSSVIRENILRLVTKTMKVGRI